MRFRAVSLLPHAPGVVDAYHDRPGALTRLTPPWERVRVERIEIGGSAGGDSALTDGTRVTLGVRVAPGVRLRWVAEHAERVVGRGFVDTQVRGPFALWRHAHRFEDAEVAGVSGCRLVDEIEYAPPGGLVGRVLGGGAVRKKLERMFAYRHATTRADLDALSGVLCAGRRLRVAVSGSGGLIGSAVVGLLQMGGHEVVRLVRRMPADGVGGSMAVLWDPLRGVEPSSVLEGLDAVVHLAGAGIAEKRWNASRCRLLRESRVDATGALVRSLGRLSSPPGVFVCASAVGFYGSAAGGADHDGFIEESGVGRGFLASLCADWEREAGRASELFGARVVQLRFGVVLSPAGGALPKLALPMMLGAGVVGGWVGSGRQRVSWVSVDDAASAAVFAVVRGDIRGPMNVVSPRWVSAEELSRAIGRVIGRPVWRGVPAWASRLALGAIADEALLADQPVRACELERAGFVFRHTELESALRHVLGRGARPMGMLIEHDGRVVPHRAGL